MGTKECFQCSTVLPIDMYHKKDDASDGLNSYCKGCARHNSREWKENNRERRNKNNARWKANNREKCSAHAAIGRAKTRGDIVVPEHCQECGLGGTITAHHADYSKWLTVEWLCLQCHAQKHIHGTRGPGIAEEDL